MDRKKAEMHLRAGTAAGREQTCGTKMQHDTLDGAQRHADALNRRPEVATGERHRVEPYPCPWCSPSPFMNLYYYHVGREMTEEEREKYAGK